MTKKNIELLRKLRRRFLRMRHPEHFRMEQIAIKTGCGAAMCFIGHTLDLAGFKMRLKKDINWGNQMASRCDYEFISPAGRVVKNPFVTAARLLGFKGVNAFYGDAVRFFQDYSIKTPQEAAQRIERLIKDK